MRFIAQTMQAAFARGVMLGDLDASNVGLTSDGRLVMHDAEAFPVGTRPRMLAHLAASRT